MCTIWRTLHKRYRWYPHFSCNAEKKLIFLAFIMESAHCILMLAALGDHVEPHVNNGTGSHHRLLHRSVTYYTQPCQYRPRVRSISEESMAVLLLWASLWASKYVTVFFSSTCGFGLRATTDVQAGAVLAWGCCEP